ncbi:hypothetical protein TcCL_Unassigned04585, partial [Trypanosoma cruzi]
MPRTQRLSSPEKAIVQPGHHFSTHQATHTRQCKYILADHCASTYVCGRLLEEQKKKEEHREAHQHSKRHSWMAAMHAVRHNLNNHARWQHTPSTKTKKRKKEKHGGRVWLCVALRVSARPDRKKTKQEGKKCVLRPTGPRRTPTRHGSLSAPFVAAPPHACSRRGA